MKISECSGFCMDVDRVGCSNVGVGLGCWIADCGLYMSCNCTTKDACLRSSSTDYQQLG